MLLQKQQLQASLGPRSSLHRCAPPVSLPPRSLVVRRAEENNESSSSNAPSSPRVKTTGRTYTEGGAPPQQPQPGQPMYAEDAAPKPKENLSPEMKKRLRDEYVGFGGTPNKLLGRRRRPAVFAAVVEDGADAKASSSDSSEGGSSLQGSSAEAGAVAAATAAAETKQQRRSKFVIDENEVMKSTPEHRIYTFGSMALMGLTLAQAFNQADSPGDWASIGAALFVSYILSDLGTGIYHWGVDNYGDGNTPVFGRQIAAFQGHHQRPWTITEREFCNNLQQVFKPASVPAAFFLAISPFAPPALSAFASSFLFLICMSQQFHAWSHTKKSDLPQVVLALQEAGILVSRRMHGAHHRAPFEGNYCIVSGMWNPILDNSGFFRKLERVIYDATKVEPRCWHEPNAEWAEVEAGPSSS